MKSIIIFVLGVTTILLWNDSRSVRAQRDIANTENARLQMLLAEKHKKAIPPAWFSQRLNEKLMLDKSIPKSARSSTSQTGSSSLSTPVPFTEILDFLNTGSKNTHASGGSD